MQNAYMYCAYIHLHIKHKRRWECMTTEGVQMARERLSITLPKLCIEWIDRQVESRTYHNRSHAIEVLILKEMKGSK